MTQTNKPDELDPEKSLRFTARNVAAEYLGLDDEDHENDDYINPLMNLLLAFAKVSSDKHSLTRDKRIREEAELKTRLETMKDLRTYIGNARLKGLKRDMVVQTLDNWIAHAEATIKDRINQLKEGKK